jgi:DNA-binding Xre family transcriptional regulator
MRWNLRMKAAERGIWKSTELRRRLAEAGLEISAGKMSGLWTGTPTTIRLDDLDVLCAVLECSPTDLLVCEPDKVAARRLSRVADAEAGGDSSSGQAPGPATITPRLGRNRTLPPA